MSNKIHIIGNLTNEPDMSYSQGGTAYTKFRLADNRRVKSDSGDTQEETIYHNMIAFSGLAETCAQYLHKGSKVSIWGRMTESKYTDRQTRQEKIYREVVVAEMEMLSPKKAGASDEEIDIDNL